MEDYTLAYLIIGFFYAGFLGCLIFLGKVVLDAGKEIKQPPPKELQN